MCTVVGRGFSDAVFLKAKCSAFTTSGAFLASWAPVIVTLDTTIMGCLEPYDYGSVQVFVEFEPLRCMTRTGVEL